MRWLDTAVLLPLLAPPDISLACLTTRPAQAPTLRSSNRHPPCRLPLSYTLADAKQLAEFWDGMTEADKRPVMDVCSEPNGELIMRQVT
jgi:hypothetical protein